MEGLDKLLESIRARAGTCSTTTDEPEYECPICKDTGTITWQDERGYWYGKECECMIRKRNQRRLERSGLTRLVESYTMEAFQTPAPWQAKIKANAEDYLLDTGDAWFFIGGPPGSGKSHICTAITASMIAAGKDCFYVRWREFAPQLKAAVTDRYEYERLISPAKKAGLLYVDDFLKGGVTEADINLAIELLDYRYGQRLPTVISSERSIDDILSIDESVGSKIYERSRGHCLRTQAENWRLRK